jgi:hypothetical protein
LTSIRSAADPSRVTDNQEAAQFYVVAVFATMIIGGAYAVAKKVLDNVQKIMLNELALKAENLFPSKHSALLELYREYNEYDIAERIEGETIGPFLNRIPFLGVTLALVVREYYNLKYEKKQLDVIERMEELLE